jgi:hypothetical protein
MLPHVRLSQVLAVAKTPGWLHLQTWGLTWLDLTTFGFFLGNCAGSVAGLAAVADLTLTVGWVTHTWKHILTGICTLTQAQPTTESHTP